MSAAADPLREGDRGGRVVELQLLLRMTGHDPGPVDGIFGPLTVAAFNAGAPGHGAAYEDEIAYLRKMRRLAVEVPRVSTPASEEEQARALALAYTRVFADLHPAPTVLRQPLLVALAQLAVEHGPDGHGIHTFNVGNIQVPHQLIDGRSSLPLVPWFDLVSKEVLSVTDKEGKIVRRDVDMKSPYYAHANLLEGCVAYWTFLRQHCAEALARFEAGDTAGACHALKVGAWHFSGNEEQYRIDMVSGYHRIAKLTGGLDPEPPEPG